MMFDLELFKAQVVFRMLNLKGLTLSTIYRSLCDSAWIPPTMSEEELAKILDSLVTMEILEESCGKYSVAELTEEAAFLAVEARIKLMS
jgi:hypothetical protein